MEEAWIDGDLKSMLENQNISSDISFLFTKNMAVPDVHRYNVEICKPKKKLRITLHHNNTTDFPCSRYSDLAPKQVDKSIVLVLESPHIDEFAGVLTNAKPVAPAQGVTGRNIESYITEHIAYAMKQGLIELGTFPIIIVESIQWNTSLSVLSRKSLDKDLRDEVFRKVWINSVEEEFIFRMERLKPCLIMNACTKGSNKQLVKELQLRNLVLHSLMGKFMDINIMGTPHPSSPYFRLSNWDSIHRKLS
jgi:hypothetical protein